MFLLFVVRMLIQILQILSFRFGSGGSPPPRRGLTLTYVTSFNKSFNAIVQTHYLQSAMINLQRTIVFNRKGNTEVKLIVDLNEVMLYMYSRIKHIFDRQII